MYPPPQKRNFWDFSKNEMLWWQKMGKVVNQVKLTIPSQSQPHFGEKIEKCAKMAVLTQSKPLFGPNLQLWVIFSSIYVKWFEKVGKLKKFANVPPPQNENFWDFSKNEMLWWQKMEKLWIRWNWPFRVNLSLILGEKIEKCAKIAVLTQSKPLFWQNLPLWVIFSSIYVKRFEKLENSKNLPMYPPPRNENFWDFSKNEMLWWQKMGKVVNQVKLTIPSQSQPHLGEKIEKCAKMAILTQSKHIFWPNLQLWVIVSSIGVKRFEKVGKLKKFANVHPPPPPEMKILRFLQKWDALVAKDGKSCESGEIDHSESISASFWGKR